MVNIAWPEKLKPASFGYFHLDADMGGGQGVGGGEQFVISPGPRWGASMSLPIFDVEGVLAMRALRSQLKGRANPAILPNFDGQRLSWPVEDETGRVLTPRVAHALKGTLGLEGTPYAGPEIPAAAEINATMAAAALRATNVVITVTQGGPILAGQQFGIGSLRLYEIGKIVSTVIDTAGDAVTTVDIWPPLRSAVAAGTAVQFTRPKCLMRCLNMNDQSNRLELLRFATLDLEFVEYF